jgi:nitric oxide reductase subunit B
LRFFYWLRLYGGLGFLVGLITYLTSFWIGSGTEQSGNTRATLQRA